MKETFSVTDVSCAHCVATVEGAVTALDGVAAADVDLETKTVTVDYDEAAVVREALVEAIEASGYPVGGPVIASPRIGHKA